MTDLCVSVNGFVSSFLSLTCGVPQGSILGPLLFIIYINDIVRSAILHFIIFADDTNLFYSHQDLATLIMIITELRSIDLWLKVNRLSLNVKNTFLFYSIPIRELLE